MAHFKLLSTISALLLAAPLLAQGPAAPGTLTYSEGQAAIAGKPVSPAAAGQTVLTPGQMLSTGNGTAEVALERGAILRLDRSTVVKAVVLDGKRSEVQLNRGRAEINVAGLAQGSEVQVDTANGVQTLLVKDGLYEFDANNNLLRVFDGKADVSNSATSGKWIDVKAGHQMALNGTSTGTTEFDRDQASDGFARRSDGFSSHGGGYGYAPGYGYGYDGELAYGYPGYYGYPYAGFYAPYAYGFYPGFYGGFGFGYGFGGYYRGGFGGRGFRR